MDVDELLTHYKSTSWSTVTTFYSIEIFDKKRLVCYKILHLKQNTSGEH